LCIDITGTTSRTARGLSYEQVGAESVNLAVIARADAGASRDRCADRGTNMCRSPVSSHLVDRLWVPDGGRRSGRQQRRGVGPSPDAAIAQPQPWVARPSSAGSCPS